MEVRDVAKAVYRVEPEAACADDDSPSGYKRTEVGVIPEDWKLTSLQMVGTFSKGQGIRKDESSSGSIPCVRYGEIYTHHNDILRKFNSHISERVAQSSTPLKSGDILFAGSGETKEEIGKAVAYVGQERAYAGGDIVILTPHGFASTFLGYSLNAPSIVRQKAARGQGDAVVHITSGSLSSVVVPIPPTLAEQQAIAETLSDADALIESLQQLIAKQRALKQGAMQALLTSRRRLPGFTGEWQTKRLGKIAVFCKGKGLPKSALDDGGRFPCVHYGELFTRLPESIRETCSRTNWAGDTFRSLINDVLMPTSDVTPSGLAKASCVVMDGVIIGGDVLVIRTDPRIICGTFLSYVIRNSESQILQLVTGTTVFHLYASDMRKFEFRVPPIAEQEAIIAVLSDMDAEIEALEARLSKTRALKAGMMQQLLTGRIRLPLERTA
ncbi:MAG TPA: restriction endonuclease subunit S [Candidatus Acidoferrales bacterium]|nr:restriction endonuclease subunit S [Candidatus Acidoferrales bacterium]